MQKVLSGRRVMICREIPVIPSGVKTKGKTMKLAIIQAAELAAMFLIAAAVSYHSGYVGGRVDGAMETEVEK